MPARGDAQSEPSVTAYHMRSLSMPYLSLSIRTTDGKAIISPIESHLPTLMPTESRYPTHTRSFGSLPEEEEEGYRPIHVKQRHTRSAALMLQARYLSLLATKELLDALLKKATRLYTGLLSCLPRWLPE